MAAEALGASRKGPVAHPFHDDSHERGQKHGDQNGEYQNHPSGQCGCRAGSEQGKESHGHAQADIGSHHEDVAMGEIEQHEDAVYHGIAQRNEGIKTPPLKGIDEVLHEEVEGHVTY